MATIEPSIKKMLLEAAVRNECSDFISSDPVQFPHRYTGRMDIEVSAFISQWIAYGSRKVFLQVLEKLHTIMDAAGGPYHFISSGAYKELKVDTDTCLYRFYKWSDFAILCDRLASVYSKQESLEGFFIPGQSLDKGVYTLCKFFEGVNGIPVPGSPSANKRFYMFLRWMVRKNSPVDFGIWTSVNPAELIIPLDTHVYQIAMRLGLTSRKNADLNTAMEITRAMAELWPTDPARGDFALYGTEIGILRE